MLAAIVLFKIAMFSSLVTHDIFNALSRRLAVKNAGYHGDIAERPASRGTHVFLWAIPTHSAPPASSFRWPPGQNGRRAFELLQPDPPNVTRIGISTSLEYASRCSKTNSR
jgi:hypothetical protein